MLEERGLRSEPEEGPVPSALEPRRWLLSFTRHPFKIQIQISKALILVGKRLLLYLQWYHILISVVLDELRHCLVPVDDSRLISGLPSLVQTASVCPAKQQQPRTSFLLGQSADVQRSIAVGRASIEVGTIGEKVFKMLHPPVSTGLVDFCQALFVGNTQHRVVEQETFSQERACVVVAGIVKRGEPFHVSAVGRLT